MRDLQFVGKERTYLLDTETHGESDRERLFRVTGAIVYDDTIVLRIRRSSVFGIGRKKSTSCLVC